MENHKITPQHSNILENMRMSRGAIYSAIRANRRIERRAKRAAYVRKWYRVV